jgi:hypothetical protein
MFFACLRNFLFVKFENGFPSEKFIYENILFDSLNILNQVVVQAYYDK